MKSIIKKNEALVVSLISNFFINEMQMKEVDVDELFSKLNISYSKFSAYLSKEFALNIDPTHLYSYPTIRQLADHLIKLKYHVGEEKKINPSGQYEPVAIIGMACRFPGHVNSPDEYWNMLKNKIDGIEEVPKNHWSADDFYDANEKKSGKMNIRKGGFIDHSQTFDAEFFGIAPREAEMMDPQHRIMLEVTWAALENAGIDALQLKNSNTAVIIGIGVNDYDRLRSRSNAYQSADAYLAIGRYPSVASGRISYFLGLTGPSYSIDVACATSLVNIHQACHLLNNRETDLVITGGMNLIFDPESTMGISKAHMLSPDGSCKTFDASANGYVRSEGCGALILKRLSDAIKDKDDIYAVIKGSAVNQDGTSNGITAPNGQSQINLMRQALVNADIKPNEVSFLEAHGTGTSLGDPIEYNAIAEVYHEHRKNPLIIGCSKTNIGHMEIAAGLGSVIKTVLCLQQQEIPANLHFKQFNRLINPKAVPALFPTELTEWKDKKRIGAVSGFGFMGTNVHLLLEEAPESKHTTKQSKSLPFILLSAKTQAALERQMKQLENYVVTNTTDMSDLSYTLAVCRTHFSYRAVIIAKDITELKSKLSKKDVVTESSQLSNKTLDKKYKDLLKQYLQGETINWRAYYPNFSHQKNKLALPTYPFERKTCWLDISLQQTQFNGDKVKHPLLGVKQILPDDVINFTQILDLSRLAYLKDHIVFKNIIFPGSAYVELLLAIKQELPELSALDITDLVIERPLKLQEASTKIISIFISRVEVGFKVKFYAHNKASYSLLASANLAENTVTLPKTPDIKSISLALKNKIIPTALYKNLNQLGLQYGTCFQTIQKLSSSSEEVLAEVKYDGDCKYYSLHPALLDGAMQAMTSALKLDNNLIPLPIQWQNFKFIKAPTTRAYVYSKILHRSSQLIEASFWLINHNEEVLAYCESIQFKLTTKQQLKDSLTHKTDISKWFYQVQWNLKPLASDGIIKSSNLLIVYDEKSPEQIRLLDTLKKSFANIECISTQDALDFQQFENLTHILYLASLIPPLKPVNQLNWQDVLSAHTLPFLKFTQQFFAQDHQCQLWILTLNSQILTEETNINFNLQTSSINGIFKSLLWEYPLHSLHQLDVDDISLNHLTNILVNEFSQTNNDQLITYRKNLRYIAALAPIKTEAKKESFIIQTTKPGALENLSQVDLQVNKALLPNELRVKVFAVGLNFRDVLSALGLYPGDPGPLGIDAVGVVEEVGVGINNFKVGDYVYGLMSGSLASHVTVDSRLISLIPPKWNKNYISAASIPTIFMTAYYGLVELAKLKRGERILIHAAAGGVGQAAIQIAQHIGAEVFVTVGSQDKKDYVKTQGVTHIYASRNTDFSKNILRDTKNEGVDVVLNCLSGVGFIEASLSACAKGARFIEIGKRDIWTLEQVKAKRADIKYHIIALDDLAKTNPNKIQRLLKTITQHFNDKAYHFISETKFPLDQVQDAFRYLKQAQHIGKVLVTIDQTPNLNFSNGCYLITGGLGGLGLMVTEYLIQQGARHIILTARHAPNADIQDKIKALIASAAEKTTIECIATDISKESSITTLQTAIKKSTLPLRGIFHLAGVVEDAIYAEQNWDKFSKVLAPKVQGAWNLYQLIQTQEHKPDICVYFSSVSSLIGTAGQANYACANQFLDEFAYWQSQQGIFTQSFSWGPWATIGMAKDLSARHAQLGMEAISPVDGMAALAYALHLPLHHTGIVHFNWANLSALPFVPAWILPDKRAGKIKHEDNLISTLSKLSKEQQLTNLQELIKKNLASVMNIPNEDIRADKGFFEMGMDSLMAMELKNLLQQHLGDAVVLNSTFVFDYPTVTQAADKLYVALKLPNETLNVAPIEPVVKTDTNTDAIAIIGMSCRFPGANNINEFWDLLSTGKDAIRPIPTERWNISQHYHPDTSMPGKIISNLGGFINDIEQFDPAFFNLSQKEAEYLDPQQRLLLEVTYEALENSHTPINKLQGSETGVFVGIATSDYSQLISKNLAAEDINAYFSTGNTASAATGRLAYFLGLEGPNMAIDTACSSSLVALHEACNALKLGECNLAISGGVNAILTPDLTISFSQAGMIAPDGHCKTFDEKANGYTRGEGCGIVILKRLQDAIGDGDNILATIQATDTNQDGTRGGLTVPSGPAQERLLKRTLQKARLTASDINYLEAHGTGTSLGDPIEVHAIGRVYGERADDEPLFLGSVKTNIGHLEAAAGIAGIIKSVLALQHGVIPAHLNFQHLNPKITADFPFKIVTQSQAWPNTHKQKFAAVSSFGFSGTNAHVILGEAPILTDKENISPAPYYLILLSAKSDSSLQKNIESLRQYLRANPEISIADVSHTLAFGRAHYHVRAAYIVKNINDFLEMQSLIDTCDHDVEYFNPLSDLAKRYLRGEKIEWDAAYFPGKFVALPNYSFNRSRYWYKSNTDEVAMNKINLNLDNAIYIREHNIFGHKIMPGAGYISWIYQYLKNTYHVNSYVLKDVMIKKPLELTPGLECEIKVEIQEKDNQRLVTFWSLDKNQQPVEHVTAILAEMNNPKTKIKLNQMNKSQLKPFDLVGFYNMDLGFYLGQYFRSIKEMYTGDNIAISTLSLSEDAKANRMPMHPSIIDCMFSTAIIFTKSKFGFNEEFVPLSVEEIVINNDLVQDDYDLVVENVSFNPELTTCDITLLSNNIPVISMKNVNLKHVIPSAIQNTIEKKTHKASHQLHKALAEQLNKYINTPVTEQLYDQDFTSLGLDSISGVEYIKEINKVFNTSIKATTLYNFPSINSLANHISTLSGIPSATENKVEEKSVQPISATNIQDANSIKTMLTAEIKKLNDTINIDNHMSFNEMGLDSIQLVELIRNLNQSLNLNLVATTLYSYTDIETLTKHIVDQLKITQPIQQVKTPEPTLDKVETSIPKMNIADTDVAIIGIACRYPGAESADELWDILKQSKFINKTVPKDLWEFNDYFSQDTQHYKESSLHYSNTVDNIDLFDALFFNISPAEAELMDPQQRIFLQEVYHALEDAGYAPESLKGQKVGTYIGVGKGDYIYKIIERNIPLDAYTLMGNDPNILAARLAYYLDLRGPAIAIDTACSSSLVAMHQAYTGLINKDCDMAISGGIAIHTTPALLLENAKANMLAPDGLSKTFDNGANGLGPSEGSGVVIMKRLADAIADGDDIYGVIKASGINQDGKTNGITAPSALSQQRLLSDIYTKFNINPRDITYIEAHGTGTKLGDPIEVQALSEAFTQHTSDKNYCAIGSIKSNIGHTSKAAGVSGVIKILMCMKNKMLVPTVNFKTPNEHINFADSPFYVSTELKTWTHPDNKLRMAGVSSFGYSGTNGHMVISEYPITAAQKFPEQAHYLFALSAKTADALKIKATQLLKYLEKNQVSPYQLSYTLNTARTHFSSRQIFIAASCDDLKNQLTNWINNPQTNIETGAGTDAKMQAIHQDYLKGGEIDWQALYPIKPLKLRMPGYPFEEKHYWLMPKIQVNTQQLNTQQTTHFSSLIDDVKATNDGHIGNKLFHHTDIYINQHIVNDKYVIPGVVYIEMACQSAKAINPNNQAVTIKNIHFLEPAIIDPDRRLSIKLSQHNNAYAFQISQENIGKPDSAVSKGYIELTNSASTPDRMDINSIKAQLSKKISQQELYALLSNIGVKHGPDVKLVESVIYDDKQSLAYLKITDLVKGSKDQFYLHPIILDSVLQGATALKYEKLKSDNSLVLPIHIDEVKIFKGVSINCYVHTRYTDDSQSKLIVSVLDEEGNVLLELKGLQFEYFRNQLQAYRYTFDWQASAINKLANLSLEKTKIAIFDTSRERLDAIAQHLQANLSANCIKVLFNADSDEYSPELIKVSDPTLFDYHQFYQSIGTQEKLITLNLLETHPKTKLNLRSAANLQFYYDLCKAFLEIKNINLLEMYHYFDQKNFDHPAQAMLYGFARSIYQENPKVLMQVIALEEERYKDAKELAALCSNEIFASKSLAEMYLRITSEGRLTKQMRTLSKVMGNNEHSFKQHGTYIITGGMGGLGYLIADYLISKHSANVIMVGRSQLSGNFLDKFKMLKQKQPQLTYYQADVSSKDDVTGLYELAKEKFSHVNGIIHCAGIIKDEYLIKKSWKNFTEVLAPKVKGTANLDEVFKDEKLDLFILFSSAAALVGNPGQTDYASANAYMDEFAYQRNYLQAQQQRTGKAISINWPYWISGGMQIDPEVIKWMKIKWGAEPLTDAAGTLLFEQCIAENLTQCAIYQGTLDISQAYKKVLSQPESNKSIESKPAQVEVKAPQAAQATLATQTNYFNLLRNQLSSIVKIDENAFDMEKDLFAYGYDSIRLTELANWFLAELNIDISPSEFYEYNSGNKILSYLNDKLKTEIPATPSAPASVSTASSTEEEASTQEHINKRDIAIIGMSGVLPGSKNLKEFWKNLCEGKNLVTEVPKERFIWQNYCDDSDILTTAIRYGGFINNIDHFDTDFFKISPREAALMDPQQRIMLELSWKAIEDAGYTTQKLSETSTGVFMGVSTSDYNELLHDNNIIQAHSGTGLAHSVLVNRISFLFNLSGPSFPVDTACSSSLIALHEAVKAIQTGDCDTALVGGINLMITPSVTLTHAKAGMLNTESACKPFDNSANGYIRGEGAGVILIKSYEQAIKDKDAIYAVIKSTATNHNGNVNSLTVPNPVAQAKLVQRALDVAGLSASDLSFIEAHGTGTPLGDPIEINALKKVFKADSKLGTEKSCGVSSTKANIGHLEASAGIASVIKVLLCMQNKTLPKLANLETPNTQLKLDDSPLYIVDTTQNWALKNNQFKRYAGISSFGFGGANAHVILGEHQSLDKNSETSDDKLFIFSAKTSEALTRTAEDFVTFLQDNKNLSLNDVAYTLKVGRQAFNHRLAIIANNQDKLIQSLQAFLQGTQDATILVNKVDPAQVSHSSTDFNNSTTMTELGKAWITGANIEWSKITPQASRVHLPTYSFEPRKIWFDQYLEHFVSKKSIKQTIQPAASPMVETAAPLIQKPAATVSNDILTKLAELISLATFTKKEEIAYDKTFTDLGVDSIVGVELAKKISDNYGITLAASILYTYPTINDLAKHIAPLINSPAVTETPAPIPSSVTSVENDIAIIGMSVRLPQAKTLDQFWNNLVKGTNLVKEIPASRWDVNQFYSNEIDASKTNCKWCGMVDDVDHFEPEFFGILPANVKFIDPQQRLYLETCWQAIEDAGYDIAKLSNQRVGFYTGVMSNDYLLLLNKAGIQSPKGDLIVGNSNSILTSRLSNKFNLKGPTLTIDTACSSSLIATHIACDTLRLGDADVMVVGGVTLYLSPYPFVGMSNAGMLSPEGKCKTFDDGANGFVPGEGVGVVVLKRLSDAIRDKDNIYAVIKGSGMNQNGKSNGITAPNGLSQEELQDYIYKKYNINPSDITYIEAHGTGTKLGDPVEIDALTNVFSRYTQKKNYCALGSVKSNIGHTAGAAGVVSLIKAALCLKNKTLVPTIHVDKPNTLINFADSPFYINTVLKPWENKSDHLRQAAVSSYGFSGSNSHVVLEEFIPTPHAQITNEPFLVPISARTLVSLREKLVQLRDFLATTKDSLSDIAYTLAIGRMEFKHRCAFVAKTTSELIEQIKNYLQDFDKLSKASNEKAANQDIDYHNLAQVRDLYQSGADIDFSKIYQSGKYYHVSLPVYPFDTKPYWYHETKIIEEAPKQLTDDLPLVDCFDQEMNKIITHKNFDTINSDLLEHMIHQARLLPGTVGLEMVLESSTLQDSKLPYNTIENITWQQPINVNGEGELLIALNKGVSNAQFNISSHTDVGDVVHAHGKLSNETLEDFHLGVKHFENASDNMMTQEDIYSVFDKHEVMYGNFYKNIEWLKLADQSAMAKLVNEDKSDTTHYMMHPGMLDSALQVAGILANLSKSGGEVLLPYYIQKIQLYKELPDTIYVRVYKSQNKSHEPEYNLDIYNQKGDILLKITNFYLRHLTSSKIGSV